MTHDETLESIEADLVGILDGVELQEFATKAEFSEHALGEVKKASTDTEDEVRKSRLQHLLVNVQIARVSKFEDKTSRSFPVFSGPLSVQAQTAWKARSDQTISMQQAAASQAPGPKGFAQKSADMTAAGLLEAMTALLAGEGTTKDAESATGDAGQSGDPSPVTPATPAVETTPAAESGSTGEPSPAVEKPTEKSDDPWGNAMDMNFVESKDPDEYNGRLRMFG